MSAKALFMPNLIKCKNVLYNTKYLI